MPEAAEQGPQAESLPRWSGEPDWYLWDGGFLALGKSDGVVPPHEHHAFQIVIAITGIARIRSEKGEWRDAPGLVVRPQVVHSYHANGTLSAMLFVDPESVEGAWLKNSMKEDITILPRSRIESCAKELAAYIERPLESPDVTHLVAHCVAAICTGQPPRRRLDSRVSRVIEAIRQADEVRMSLEEAGALAFLSPSRFAHLFKQQVGLPFRRYMLWRKLNRAILVIGRNGSITEAAYEAGFSDAAHLTRTFYQMFGLPPSVMLRGGFFVIPSPFELAGAVPA